MPPGRLRGGVECAAFCSTLISEAAQSQQKLASAVQSQQKSLSFRLPPNCGHLDLVMWLRTSVPSCLCAAQRNCCLCALQRAPGGSWGWGSWARRSLLWLQAGAAALGRLSGSSGRAMLTSGGRLRSSHPSAGLPKVGLMEAFHPLTPFYVSWRFNRKGFRSPRAASSTSATTGPFPFKTWGWPTRADTSA